jgi:hypothetical protein
VEVDTTLEELVGLNELVELELVDLTLELRLVDFEVLIELEVVDFDVLLELVDDVVELKLELLTVELELLTGASETQRTCPTFKSQFVSKDGLYAYN